jgi:hypothetical protein
MLLMTVACSWAFVPFTAAGQRENFTPLPWLLFAFFDYGIRPFSPLLPEYITGWIFAVLMTHLVVEKAFHAPLSGTATKNQHTES